jgi:beta-galactosidase
MAAHLNLDHFIRRTVTAAVFSNCDEVELWINSKKMGRRKPSDFPNGVIEWTFEYASGQLKTVGYRNGKAVCSHELKTAGEAKNIALTPDSTSRAAHCGDIIHVEVLVTDENGILCPTAEELIDFSLSGDGEILGACSPDINTRLGFTLPKVISSGGKALLIIKAGASPGTLKLTAYSEKLAEASIAIVVR